MEHRKRSPFQREMQCGIQNTMGKKQALSRSLFHLFQLYFNSCASNNCFCFHLNRHLHKHCCLGVGVNHSNSILIMFLISTHRQQWNMNSIVKYEFEFEKGKNYVHIQIEYNCWKVFFFSFCFNVMLTILVCSFLKMDRRDFHWHCHETFQQYIFFKLCCILAYYLLIIVMNYVYGFQMYFDRSDENT